MSVCVFRSDSPSSGLSHRPVCPPQTRGSHIERIPGAGTPKGEKNLNKVRINNWADTQVRPYGKPIPCFQGGVNNPLRPSA